jgi:pimeloyl-ACP methyl ester carboxylesterase/DNA-binding CsgD family transcriptional regulator
LLVNTCWLSHLQHDWQSPVWRHFVAELGELASVTRYDERGFGLSDWDVEDFSLDARVADLDAVVAAAGLNRFALLGMAQGGPVAIAYAHRYPQRVSRLILFATYAAGSRGPDQLAMEEAFAHMIRVGWARPDAVFRRVFTNLIIPGATEEQMCWFDELQRMSTSADVLLAARQERLKTDVTGLLSELTVPTVVLHGRHEQMVEFSEARVLASSIPGARLVPLESANHILLADEPAWQVFRDEVAAFLEPDRTVGADVATAVEPLTARELDVLRLAAAGLDNEAIAGRLSLSARTVERHLSNVYVKLGVSGRVARAAAVAYVLRQPSSA